jgi:hypothetical protein
MECHIMFSFCLRVRRNELDRCFDGVNLVYLIVRDLKSKFFLKRHHNLNSVQAIQPEILLEMSSRCHLKDIWRLIMIFQHLQSYQYILLALFHTT